MNPYQPIYKQILSQAEGKILHQMEAKRKEMQFRQYVLALANIRACLPDLLDRQNKEAVIYELLAGRIHAPLDPHFPQKVFDYQLKGRHREVLESEKQPYIFCTYHLGSYRAILGILTRYGFDFSLVIDENVYTHQGESIRKSIEKGKIFYNSPSRFEMINAEAYDSAMIMANHVREGRSLVIYLDGNTGKGGVFRHDEKLEKVHFFGNRVFARKGIAMLSYILKTPVCPVIGHREGEMDVVLEFCDLIEPEKGRTKAEYCTETTQKLYDILEVHLRKHPLQWEGWLYLHKYFDIEYLEKNRFGGLENADEAANGPLQFNDERYSLFRHGNDHFLFDGNTFTSYLISKKEFGILKSFHRDYGRPSGKPKLRDREVLSDLMTKGILKGHLPAHLNPVM